MNPTPVAWLHEEETSWWVTKERSYDEGETPLFTEAQLRRAAVPEVDLNPETSQRLIDTIKYMVGIAERGRGYKCPDNVLPERFLLEYVIELEAPIRQDKADAARYRFIMQGAEKLPKGTKFYPFYFDGPVSKETIDETVDAAIAKALEY